MFQTFSRVKEDAAANDREFIISILDSNKALTHALASMLRREHFIAMLDGTIDLESLDVDEQPDRRALLPVKFVSFKHLEGTPLVRELLAAMEPTIYGAAVGIPEGRNLFGDLIYALAVNPGTHLPRKHYVQLGERQGFIAGCVIRYDFCGRRLAADKPTDLFEFSIDKGDIFLKANVTPPLQFWVGAEESLKDYELTGARTADPVIVGFMCNGSKRRKVVVNNLKQDHSYPGQVRLDAVHFHVGSV